MRFLTEQLYTQRITRILVWVNGIIDQPIIFSRKWGLYEDPNAARLKLLRYVRQILIDFPENK